MPPIDSPWKVVVEEIEKRLDEMNNITKRIYDEIMSKNGSLC